MWYTLQEMYVGGYVSMDTFIEQIVVKRRTYGDVLLQTALWVFGIFLGLLILWFAFFVVTPYFFVGIFLTGLLWYGVYRLSGFFYIEYEYSVTNGYFDIDKIVAKRSRKRLLSMECKNAESFGKYREAEHAQRSYDLRIMVPRGVEDPNNYYLTVRLPDKGHVLVVFTPDERTLAAVRRFLPKQVVRDADSRG